MLFCRIPTKDNKYAPNVAALVLLSVSVSDGQTMVKARLVVVPVAVLVKWFATLAMGEARRCP